MKLTDCVPIHKSIRRAAKFSVCVRYVGSHALPCLQQDQFKTGPILSRPATFSIIIIIIKSSIQVALFGPLPGHTQPNSQH